MSNLYFVRHGQTVWNQSKQLQGLSDSPLTNEGVEQAIALQPHLAYFDLCLTSPLGRAQQTAKLLCLEPSKIINCNLVSEMGFGELEGMEKSHFQQQFPEVFYHLWHRADRYDPSLFGGDTFSAMQARADKFLTHIRQNYANKDLLIVSHGMMLKVILLQIAQKSLAEFWQTPVPINTSVTTVELKDNQFTISDFSRVDHLNNPAVVSYI